LAAAVDAGFDIAVLATMLDSLARFSDQEVPLSADTDVGALREILPHMERAAAAADHGGPGRPGTGAGITWLDVLPSSRGPSF
jgi:hypothetical protein